MRVERERGGRQSFMEALAAAKKAPEAVLQPKSYRMLLDFLGPSGGSTGGTGMAHGNPGKRGVALPLLACHLLYRGLAPRPDWPPVKGPSFRPSTCGC